MIDFKDCMQAIASSMKQLTNSNFIDPAAEASAKAKGLYRAATEPGFLRKLDAYVRNMYLSALPSNVQNIVSNITNIALQPVITAVQAPFSKKVEVADVGRQISGMAKGFMLAAPRFWDNLSTTVKQGGIGYAPETGRDMAYQAGGKVSDSQWINRIMTLPIAMTKALDEGSRAVLQSMGTEVVKAKLLNDPRLLAFAKKQGIPEAELSKELNHLLMGETGKLDILQNTVEFGKYKKEIDMWSDFNLYNQPLGNSPIDKLAKKIEGVREALPGLGSFLLPFIKIPVNVAKEGATFIPGLGELRVASVKSDIAKNAEVMANTKTKLTEAKRLLLQQEKSGQDPMLIGSTKARINKLNQEMVRLTAAKDFFEKLPGRFRAQQMIGLGVGATTYSLAQAGYVTGHFNDPQLRAKMEAAGIPEMSVKIGDRWVNYGRLEPFSTVMGMVADWVQHEKSMAADGKPLLDQKTAAVVPKIIVQNFLDKTFTQGLTQMLAAVQDPERHGTWYANLAGGIVPAAVAQAARVQDPTKRETKEGLASVGNVIQSRIPDIGVGLPSRKDLPASVDILGQPVQTANSQVEGLLGKTPLTPVVESALGIKPPVQTQVQKLLENPYFKIGKMTKDIYGIELTPSELANLRSTAGKEVVNELNNLLTDPGFTNASRPSQAFQLKRVFTKVRGGAKMEMLDEIISKNPAREQEIDLNKMKSKGEQEDTGK
jgi:hypothetical protein